MPTGYEFKLVVQNHTIYLRNADTHETKKVSYVDYLSELISEGWAIDTYEATFSQEQYTVLKRPLPDLDELADQTQEILDGHAD